MTSYVEVPPPPGAPRPVNLYNASCTDELDAGIRHGWVCELQRLLRTHGFEVVVDGVCDRATRDALMSFQESAGLRVSARLDTATRRELYRTPLSKPPSDRLAGLSARVAEASREAIQAKVPFIWGGGHDTAFGPSLGTSLGCTDCTSPCIADTTVGVDCSGFTRWVYWAAGAGEIGQDTGDQLANPWFGRVPTAAAVPGDLVFAGTVEIDPDYPDPHLGVHVGVYIGPIDDVPMQVAAPHTGENVRLQRIDTEKLIGYYHLGAGPGA
ncbi:peptidoglycan-binding protein [Actinoplanes sp. NPDC049265]|uniref:peptidoglycan-binding protein n=1 Tax=Actinoplanes sp. NPDC049265 TaxID=3363902 RepID=UPI0037122A54